MIKNEDWIHYVPITSSTGYGASFLRHNGLVIKVEPDFDGESLSPKGWRVEAHTPGHVLVLQQANWEKAEHTANTMLDNWTALTRIYCKTDADWPPPDPWVINGLERDYDITCWRYGCNGSVLAVERLGDSRTPFAMTCNGCRVVDSHFPKDGGYYGWADDAQVALDRLDRGGLCGMLLT
jgi:hypothetical protein